MKSDIFTDIVKSADLDHVVSDVFALWCTSLGGETRVHEQRVHYLLCRLPCTQGFSHNPIEYYANICCPVDAEVFEDNAEVIDLQIAVEEDCDFCRGRDF